MRKRFLVPVIALFVGAASSPFWLVSAADSASIARLTADVSLERDAEYLTGFIPTRTTIGTVFDRHMIEGPEKAVLVASIGNAFDLRRIRAGQPYTIDRMLDGRVRRFEYEIDADRRLTATRGSLDGPPRFQFARHGLQRIDQRNLLGAAGTYWVRAIDRLNILMVPPAA